MRQDTQASVAHYTQDEEAAYRDWYVAHRQIETGVPGSEVALPSLEQMKLSFMQWLTEKHSVLRKLICVDWNYPARRQSPGFDDAVTIAVALSEWLLARQGLVLPAPLCVAVILSRRGLDAFCSVDQHPS